MNKKEVVAWIKDKTKGMSDLGINCKIVIPGETKDVSVETKTEDIFKLKEYEDCEMLFVVGYDGTDWDLSEVMFAGNFNEKASLFFV